MDQTDSRPLILILDDDALLRKLISIIAEKAGYRTIQAEDGIKGLEMARALNPNLITTDLDMPNCPGDQFVLSLRSEGILTEVIMITGNSSWSDKKAIEVGANFYFQKPFNSHDLLAYLKKQR